MDAATGQPGVHRRHVLYPDMYVWFVLVSALDIMVTVTLLVHLGAREVNSFAQWSIEQFGTWGLIGLKFLCAIFVIVICEIVGRRRPWLGRVLALTAIFISLTPIAAALIQVGYFAATGRLIIEEWPR